MTTTCKLCNETLLAEGMHEHNRKYCRHRRRKSNAKSKFPCPKCGKQYETQGKYYKKHVESCGSTLETTSPPKRRRRPGITGEMRLAVWERWVGQRTRAKCFCCWQANITMLSNHMTFHAGHIISDHNGGDTSVENMLPICRDCNMNMSAENWDDYIKRNKLPMRRAGKNPPIAIYMKGIIWWQSLARMWLERKRLRKLLVIQ